MSILIDMSLTGNTSRRRTINGLEDTQSDSLTLIGDLTMDGGYIYFQTDASTAVWSIRNDAGTLKFKNETTGTDAIRIASDGTITTFEPISGTIQQAVQLRDTRQILGQDFNGTQNVTASSSNLTDGANIALLDATQTFSGTNTFSNTISGDIDGNSATASKIASIDNSNIALLNAIQTFTNECTFSERSHFTDQVDIHTSISTTGGLLVGSGGINAHDESGDMLTVYRNSSTGSIRLNIKNQSTGSAILKLTASDGQWGLVNFGSSVGIYDYQNSRYQTIFRENELEVNNGTIQVDAFTTAGFVRNDSNGIFSTGTIGESDLPSGAFKVTVNSDTTSTTDQYVNFTENQVTTSPEFIKANGGFKYNPSTNTLTVTNLVGNASTCTTATQSTYVLPQVVSHNTTHYMAFVFSTSGQNRINVDTNMTYNPFTNVLTVPNINATDFTGDLTGDVTGNVTGNVTGDLIGNVTGDLTGNADSSTEVYTSTTGVNSDFYILATNDINSGNTDVLKSSSFKWNANSGVITAPTFSGSLSGNATTASTATVASTVSVGSTNTDSSFLPTFVNSLSGNRQIKVDDNYRYNPSTNTLTCPNVSGACTQLRVNTETTSSATHYLLFTSSYGTAVNASPLVSNKITFAPSAGTLVLTGVTASGTVSANTFSGNLSGTASQANAVYVGTQTLNSDYFIPYCSGSGTNGYEDLQRSTGFKINPSTNTLTVAGGLSGQLIAGTNISFSTGTTYDGRQNITISSSGGSGGGTTTNALTDGNGIQTFSFDGGTAGVQVAVDFGTSSSTSGSEVVSCADTRLSDERYTPYNLVPGDGLSGQAWDGGSVGLANETWTVDATVVRTNATNQTIGGTKTFSNTIIGSIDGQAGNVEFSLSPGDGLSYVLGSTYDGSEGRTIKINFGSSSSTSSTEAVACNDTRLSDERYTPYNLVPGDGLSGQAWDGGSVGLANETWTVDATVVRTNATNQTINGTKTFSNTIIGSIDGQAGNVEYALSPGDGLSYVLGSTYDGSEGRTIKINFGSSSSTSSTEAVACNDTRLSDSRPASSIDTTSNGFVTTTSLDGTIYIRNLTPGDIPNNNSEAGSVANDLTAGTGLSSTGTYNGSTARTFNISFGSVGGSVCEGNDSRLSDSRPASSIDTTTDGFVRATGTNGTIDIRGLLSSDIPDNLAQAGSISNALTAGTGLSSSGTFDGLFAREFSCDFGSNAGQVCEGNDSRLSDVRTADSIDTTTNGFVQTINSNGTLLIRNLQSGDIPNNASEAGSVAYSLLTANGLLSSGAYNGSVPRTISVDFGNSSSTSSSQAVKCSDTRLSDTRNTTNSLSQGDGISTFSFNGSSSQTVGVNSSVIRTTGNQSMSGTKTFSEKVNIESSATNGNSLLTLEKTGNYESKMNFISGSMPPSGEISIGIDQATTGRGLCMSNYDGGVFSFGYINALPNHYTINLDTTSNVTIKPIKANGVTDCNHTTEDYKLIDFKASSSSNSGLRINTNDSFIALGEDINHTAPADEILRINTDQTIDMYTHFENVGSGGALYHASRNAEADSATFGIDQDGDLIIAQNGGTVIQGDKSSGTLQINTDTVFNCDVDMNGFFLQNLYTQDIARMNRMYKGSTHIPRWTGTEWSTTSFRKLLTATGNMLADDASSQQRIRIRDAGSTTYGWATLPTLSTPVEMHVQCQIPFQCKLTKIYFGTYSTTTGSSVNLTIDNIKILNPFGVIGATSLGISNASSTTNSTLIFNDNEAKRTQSYTNEFAILTFQIDFQSNIVYKAGWAEFEYV